MGPTTPERPHVHFTPPEGWMNDPNGLVHLDGLWHLCYQHHPGSLDWGPMHWGRATSRDLVTWEHHPIAIEPDDLGTAFSGSAVVDTEGVAGFGAGVMLAFYTHFKEGHPQSQGIAVSEDNGLTWTAYAGNPVLSAPAGLVDFRDPKVLRYEDHWIMVVAAGSEVIFHRSHDLLRWVECGRFGHGHGAHEGEWETPDLFRLEVAATGEWRWVLVVSVLAGGPAGGTGTQYFVGSFDGSTFACDSPPDEVRWVDSGADFYAPQSWYGAPGGRLVWLAWMSNWAYARVVPTAPWRGVMTLPRDVTLAIGDEGRPLLVQRPTPELDQHGTVVVAEDDVALTHEAPWRHSRAPAAYDLSVVLRPERAVCILEVHAGDGAGTQILYDPRAQVLRVLRDAGGLGTVDALRPQVVPLPLSDGVLGLRVLVDTCSVEIFAAGGRVVLTNQVFPRLHGRGLTIGTGGGPARLVSLTLRDLTVR